MEIPLKDLAQKIASARWEIQQSILNLPDNPRIKRLGGSCFVLSSKDLGDNWTAEHHDFKQSYRMVSDYISRVDAEVAYDRLVEITQKGFLIVGNQRQYFHADVIQHLKSLL